MRAIIAICGVHKLDASVPTIVNSAVNDISVLVMRIPYCT